jgi:hydrogenase maturation protease
VISNNTLILGIGNTLLSDEGAGIHILNKLQSDYPDLQNITFIDGGTLSFTLATYLQDCSDVIVLDAAEFKAPPGTVRTLVGAEMDKFLGAARRSPHEVGLLDLFDIARLTESLPVKRALVGIQPKSIEWGMSPTPPVEAALALAVDETVKLMRIWAEERQQSTRSLPESSTKAAEVDPAPVITP